MIVSINIRHRCLHLKNLQFDFVFKWKGFLVFTEIMVTIQCASINFYISGALSSLSAVRKYSSEKWMLSLSACTSPGESFPASGHISSPNFPDNFTSNSICIWNITVPSGKIIKMTFLKFTLVIYEHSDCSGADQTSARIFITNVASHNGDPNNFTLCGQDLPYPVYSEENFIQVRFESRTGTVNKGFNASYKAIDGELCK